MKRILSMGLALSLTVIGAAACKNLGPTPVPYTCESGKALEVQYPTDQTAFVYYEGKRYRLTAVPAASGALFSDSKFQWHTKGTGPGSTGILQEVNKNSDEPTVLDTCREGN